MNDIYQSMLSEYDLSTDQAIRNATFEVNQQVILAGLYQGGFFDKAAFYGGTCLRIFHGLPPKTTHDCQPQKYKVWQDGLITRQRSQPCHPCQNLTPHRLHKAGCRPFLEYEATCASHECQRMQKSDVPYS